MKKQGDSHFYIHASVGRGREVITELEKHGGVNRNCYKGEGDKTMLYYIGRDNTIEWTTEETDIGYVIVNSGWTEIKLKEPKKERMYVISVKEGCSKCNGCQLHGKCNDDMEKKCELAALLKTDKALDGKTLAVVEVDPEEIPFHVFEKISEAKS